jgi:hypothetical protein
MPSRKRALSSASSTLIDVKFVLPSGVMRPPGTALFYPGWLDRRITPRGYSAARTLTRTADLGAATV